MTMEIDPAAWPVNPRKIDILEQSRFAPPTLGLVIFPMWSVQACRPVLLAAASSAASMIGFQ